MLPITRKRLLISAAATIVIFVASCWGAALLLESRLDEIPLPDTDPGLSLWAHRGLGDPPNTPQAALDALLAGYGGVELDVRWYPGLGLRVGHDPLPSDAAAELPTLRDLLVSTGGRSSYWIDLKGLTSENVEDVAGAFSLALPSPEIGARLWIESRNLEQLARVRERVEGIVSVAHAGPAQRYRPWPPYLLFLADLLRHQIPAVSLEHRDLSANLSVGLEPLILMVYTVNDSESLARAALLGARVALTDTLPPEGPR